MSSYWSNLTLYHLVSQNYEQFLHLSYLWRSSRFHVGVYQKNTGQKNLHLKKSHDFGNIWEILWKELWLFRRIFTRNQNGFLDETLQQKLSLLLAFSFKCNTRAGKASNVSAVIRSLLLAIVWELLHYSPVAMLTSILWNAADDWLYVLE